MKINTIFFTWNIVFIIYNASFFLFELFMAIHTAQLFYIFFTVFFALAIAFHFKIMLAAKKNSQKCSQ